MRLIDADALKAEIVKTLGISERKYLLPAENAIWKVIDKMPTIEPEPQKGEWISEDAVFGGVPYRCSSCGGKTRDTIMGKPRWKFCPMCGSYNGGDQE